MSSGIDGATLIGVKYLAGNFKLRFDMAKNILRLILTKGLGNGYVFF